MGKLSARERQTLERVMDRLPSNNQIRIQMRLYSTFLVFGGLVSIAGIILTLQNFHQESLTFILVPTAIVGSLIVFISSIGLYMSKRNREHAVLKGILRKLVP